MNNLVKAGVGAALAFGAVAAHASIVVGSSSGALGNAILFADVFQGTTFKEAYVGDTGIAISTITSGTPANFNDPNLQSFLTTFATAGTTVYWVLEGGGDHFSGGVRSPDLISSSQTVTPVAGRVGSQLSGYQINLNNQVGTINGAIAGGVNPTANFLVTNDDTVLSGTGFNPLALAADISNWFGNANGNVSTTGLGTAATVYHTVAANIGGSTAETLTPLFTATLTASGLSFAPLAAVPIPAALWLLGSGLLGLAGVARRKVAAA